MIPPEIEQIFDKSTKKLFDQVKKNFNISFSAWENNFWEVERRGDNAIIFYDTHEITTSSLSHELLHLWLKQFDFLSMNYLSFNFSRHDFWGQVWNKRLCDHVGNCMAHHKMYPKYIEMGYAPELFISNANKPQATIQVIKPIYLKRNGRTSANDTELFIAHLTSIYACSYGHNYTKQLELLKKKDKDLFDIISNFWSSWEDFNLSYENNDTQPLYDVFMDQLKEWYENKTVEAK